MKKITLAALLVGAILTGCTNRKEKMISIAKENLEQNVAYPKQLKLIGISEPDSAFGENYYTKDEIRGIMNIMAQVSTSIMKRTKNMTTFNPEDTYVMALAERQMAATSDIRSMILQSEKKGEWSGWKIKIDYQCADKDGIRYKAERWMFFDKKGEKITKTFELPLP